MVVIADKRLPWEVKSKLSEYGKLIEMESSGIVYEAISGHPDIFLCVTKDELIIAPNTPLNIKDQLAENGLSFKSGSKNLGAKYPKTAYYNAVVTDRKSTRLNSSHRL